MKATPISNTADELPKGWTQTTVGEIAARVQYGTSAKTGPASGGVPVIRMGNIADGRLVIDKLKYLPKDHKEFPELLLAKGDVLFNRTNSAELVGKTTVYQGNPEPCSFASYLIRVRLGDGYRPELLAHYINSCFGRSWVSSVVSQQVGQANVNGSKLQALQLLVPPLAEQHRIVAEIEKQFTRLDAAVKALKYARVNLKRYRASVLKAACEGRLVSTEAELARAEGRDYEPADLLLQRILKERRAKWEARARAKLETKNKGREGNWIHRYKEPQPPVISDVAILPEGWVWSSIDQLTVVVRGASPRPAGDKRFFGGSVPWITVGALTAEDTPFLRAVDETVTEAGKRASRYIEPDTLLVTNSGATLGVPKITLIGGCINDGSVALLYMEYPTKLYAYFFLKTQTKALRRINQGAAQPNLNTSIVKSISVPLPPLSEQERIVTEVRRRISVIEEVESLVAGNLKRADRLRQSILKRAFEGKLVAQDPTDEPASVLLERIRAERAGEGEAAASRKDSSRTKRRRA